jgi:DNA-binding IclR family transcriptional regulator
MTRSSRPASTPRATIALHPAVRPQSSPRSAMRIPQLLSLLAGEPEGATLSQISARTLTPKSSLLALLRGLLQSGFLQSREGRYVIGPEAVKLAAAILAQHKFPDAVRPVVDALALATGESALLARLDPDAGAAVYIHKAESRNALRFIAEVGSREPLYSSAVGRVLLAFQPREWREAYLRRTKLVPLTPKTETRRRELARLVDAARSDRLAVSHEETIEGVTGIAAPVFDSAGEVLAGIVIGAPTLRALSHLRELQQNVCDAARKISQLMGYSGQ